MNAELFNALDLLEKESGISKEYMLSKIEEALANVEKITVKYDDTPYI